MLGPYRLLRQLNTFHDCGGKIGEALCFIQLLQNWREETGV